MKDSKFSILYPILAIFFLSMQSVQFGSFGNVSPDFIMILTIIYACSRGSLKGELFGFIMGLLIDIMSGTLFGLNAFVLTLLGSCITPFQRTVKVANIVVFILYLILGTVIKYIFYTLFYSLYENTRLLDWYFLFKIPSEIFVNTILGIVLYIIIARVDTRENYEWF